MSKGHDPNFDGSYATSRYAKGSLEDDILRAMGDQDKNGRHTQDGVVVGETDDGGMFKYNLDTGRRDLFTQGSPQDFHAWDDPSTGDRGYHDDKGNTHSCYLTSACLKHFMDNFDDNCHELTVLRWFRDHFVKADDVALYYKVAPLIVEKIDSLPIKEQDDVYASIYKDVVDACVHFIENGQYNDAYERYMRSTLALQERFLPATV